MANQAAPLRDFTVGTPASRIHMAGTYTAQEEIVQPMPSQTSGFNVPAPKGSTLSTGGGGGGGAVTYSTPITG